jgi:hypothetical protein
MIRRGVEPRRPPPKRKPSGRKKCGRGHRAARRKPSPPLYHLPVMILGVTYWTRKRTKEPSPPLLPVTIPGHNPEQGLGAAAHAVIGSSAASTDNSATRRKARICWLLAGRIRRGFNWDKSVRHLLLRQASTLARAAAETSPAFRERPWGRTLAIQDHLLVGQWATPSLHVAG